VASFQLPKDSFICPYDFNTTFLSVVINRIQRKQPYNVLWTLIFYLLFCGYVLVCRTVVIGMTASAVIFNSLNNYRHSATKWDKITKTKQHLVHLYQFNVRYDQYFIRNLLIDRLTNKSSRERIEKSSKENVSLLFSYYMSYQVLMVRKMFCYIIFWCVLVQAYNSPLVQGCGTIFWFSYYHFVRMLAHQCVILSIFLLLSSCQSCELLNYGIYCIKTLWSVSGSFDTNPPVDNFALQFNLTRGICWLLCYSLRLWMCIRHAEYASNIIVRIHRSTALYSIQVSRILGIESSRRLKIIN
jgi:hypothetical protein